MSISFGHVIFIAAKKFKTKMQRKVLAKEDENTIGKRYQNSLVNGRAVYKAGLKTPHHFFFLSRASLTFKKKRLALSLERQLSYHTLLWPMKVFSASISL